MTTQTIKELDEKFNAVKYDSTDGDYKMYKSANKKYIFYDDLTVAQKNIMIKHNLAYDSVGRICDENNDCLITRVEFEELK